MKFSDYKRLGKISIKSRKKSTKNTVRGISFGLILLVSVIFLTFAAFVSFNTEINKIRTIATFNVESKNFYDASASDIGVAGEYTWDYKQGVFSYNAVKGLKEDKNCLESLSSNVFSFNNDVYNGGSILATLEGKEPVAFKDPGNDSGSYQRYSTSVTSGVRVCNLEQSDGKILLDAELEDLGDTQPFIAGGSFSKDNSKKEIIISQQAADIIDKNKNYRELIGKKVTFTVSAKMMYDIFIDNDNDPGNQFVIPQDPQYLTYKTDIISEFVIKGILNEKVYSLLTRMDSEPHIWISEKSFYYEENSEIKSLLPIITPLEVVQDNSDYTRVYQIYTYNSTESGEKEKHTQLSTFAKDNGLFFPFLSGMNLNKQNWNSWGSYNTSLKVYTMLQGESFSSAVDLAAVIARELALINPGLDSTYISDIYQGAAYSLFNTLFTALQVVMLILYIFGGVLFVTSLLNLYNSINYSVQARRNYLGMMRAIGARDSTIPKMYFVEMVLIFMRTLIWVLIFAFLICFGLSMLVKQLMATAGDFLLGMNLSLNLIYFPLALIIVYGIMFIIAVLFALTACKSVSKKPVLDVLRTDI